MVSRSRPAPSESAGLGTISLVASFLSLSPSLGFAETSDCWRLVAGSVFPLFAPRVLAASYSPLSTECARVAPPSAPETHDVSRRSRIRPTQIDSAKQRQEDVAHSCPLPDHTQSTSLLGLGGASSKTSLGSEPQGHEGRAVASFVHFRRSGYSTHRAGSQRSLEATTALVCCHCRSPDRPLSALTPPIHPSRGSCSLPLPRDLQEKRNKVRVRRDGNSPTRHIHHSVASRGTRQIPVVCAAETPVRPRRKKKGSKTDVTRETSQFGSQHFAAGAVSNR
jgi:hypothetical protein